MSDESVIEILGELLSYESQSLLPRLAESTSFVSWASADEQGVVSEMINEETEHREWLVEAIRDLGGDPPPVWAGIESVNVNYLELSFVLPRVLEDRKRLLKFYESAAAQVGSNARAHSVISRIIERHRKHIQQLTKLTQRVRSLTV